MEKNKTGKYLKYAIGEIVLVVIGILIALQVNNWNNQQQEQKTEVAILKEIYSNLKEDGEIIHGISLKRQAAETAILRLLDYIDDTEINEDSLSNDLTKILTFERYYPIRNGYERSKNADIHFSNEMLTNKISRYYEFEQNRVVSAIKDIEIFFIALFENRYGLRTHLKLVDKDQTVKIKDIKDPVFKEDLLNEIITFRDNNHGTTLTVMAFEDINAELTRLVEAQIKKL
jgi:Family of unknown function (DUF6090)